MGKGKRAQKATDNAEEGGKDTACSKKAAKPIDLPAWKKVKVDMEHIKSGHTATGSRAVQSGQKDLFPKDWSEKKIEGSIRQAYRYGQKKLTQGDRIFVEGTGGGRKIQMWVNKATKTVESAWPK